MAPRDMLQRHTADELRELARTEIAAEEAH
ncbi:hypothetical protein HNR02_007049 [Amycolatopsis endophytica]|uniref:Uncharacterized protein n=1 Tax=Amycolatopsis endophytica TaxID=860233 RepID=A0A853BG18_9PSEU|nr:hypothetical protein [Amycolatopsis endophytica]